MKLPLFLFIPVLLLSCNSGTNTPTSTPIDSTNVRGTAPADYSNPSGKMKLPDENQGSGHRANTPGGDSLPSMRGVEKPDTVNQR